MWILAKRDTDCPYGTSDHVRALPFDDLVQLTAMELGVPVGDVPLHIDMRALDILSRYGPPVNFPAPMGTTERTHDAQGYSSPIRQAMMACNYLTGISERVPDSTPPPPPTPDAGSRGPHPSSSSSGTTSVGTVRSGTRIPGRAVGEGLGQGPIDSPPPIDRRSCLATAPARFKTGTDWRKYCTPPSSLGADKMLVRIGATQLPPGKQGVGNVGEHAAATLCGTPTLLCDILKMWTGHTNLRKLASFSRTWLGSEYGLPQQQRVLDGAHYLGQLRQWYEANEDGTVMGSHTPGTQTAVVASPRSPSTWRTKTRRFLSRAKSSATPMASPLKPSSSTASLRAPFHRQRHPIQ
jgi:hypothetical protein